MLFLKEDTKEMLIKVGIDKDISNIKLDLESKKTLFLHDVLRGCGWKQYNNLTESELIDCVLAQFEDEDEPIDEIPNNLLKILLRDYKIICDTKNQDYKISHIDNIKTMDEIKYIVNIIKKNQLDK